MNGPQGATSSGDALQSLIEYPWAPKEKRMMFPEGTLIPTGPPLTAEVCLETTRLLAGQLRAYTDGLAKAGGAGVIMTCGGPADPTILH